MMRTQMQTQTPKYARPAADLYSMQYIRVLHVRVINVYTSLDAAIILLCMVCNCCSSLYLNVAGVLKKCFWGPEKVLEFL